MACKKHFEDDIKRKLTDLGINGSYRTEIVSNIMGSEVTKEEGFIDCENDTEFDNELQVLQKYGMFVKRRHEKPTLPIFLVGLANTKRVMSRK